ncbi:hypothetical protein BS78_08G121300 [Paspalum vaginatum]|nr:hypothetical protein BS78_08G121300 [Paspalum vaginatum]
MHRAARQQSAAAAAAPRHGVAAACPCACRPTDSVSRPAHWRLRPVIASATDAHCYYIKIRRQQNTVALAKQVRQTLRQYVLLEITVICSRS